MNEQAGVDRNEAYDATLMARLADLEQRLAQLEQMRMHEARQAPGVHVERIDYHFDQLKVEKLEGTLHVGVLPHSGGAIEQFSLDHMQLHRMQLPDIDEDVQYTRIAAQIETLLQGEVQAWISEKAADQQLIIGESYRQLMIQDLRRQTGERIRLYLLSRTPQREEAEAADQGEWESRVTARVVGDIQEALTAHFAQLHQGR